MPTAPSVTTPNFDPGAAYPQVGQLRAAITAGDWTAVTAVFAGLEPAERTKLVQIGAEEPRVEALLRQALERDPDDTLAAAMLGHHLIKAAWTVRTGARAQYVSREQFATFFAILRQAEQILIDAAARNPADVSVWVARLITARGLQLGLSEVRRRYDRLAAHDPHHLPGQETMLQSLCPKWGGDWEDLRRFVRECMLAAPEGSHNAVLVVQGHLERWLELDPGADQRYLTSADVKAEIYEAAQRSVWHPQFRRTIGWVSVRSTFAMAFSLMGDEEAAAREFVALGDFASESFWQYLGDPVQEFRARRARALAKGAKR